MAILKVLISNFFCHHRTCCLVIISWKKWFAPEFASMQRSSIKLATWAIHQGDIKLHNAKYSPNLSEKFGNTMFHGTSTVHSATSWFLMQCCQFNSYNYICMLVNEIGTSLLENLKALGNTVTKKNVATTVKYRQSMAG